MRSFPARHFNCSIPQRSLCQSTRHISFHSSFVSAYRLTYQNQVSIFIKRYFMNVKEGGGAPTGEDSHLHLLISADLAFLVPQPFN